MPRNIINRKNRINLKVHGEDIKQVIILRKDLGMGIGKMVAQGAHASLLSFLYTKDKYNEIANEWLFKGETKIVLKINSQEEFKNIKATLRDSGIPYRVVMDAGQTQVPPGSETAIGIGPYYSKDIDNITKKLKLL